MRYSIVGGLLAAIIFGSALAAVLDAIVQHELAQFAFPFEHRCISPGCVPGIDENLSPEGEREFEFAPVVGEQI